MERVNIMLMSADEWYKMNRLAQTGQVRWLLFVYRVLCGLGMFFWRDEYPSVWRIVWRIYSWLDNWARAVYFKIPALVRLCYMGK